VDSIFTAEHVFHSWIRLATPSDALSRITLFLGFDVYTVSMTLVDAT